MIFKDSRIKRHLYFLRYPANYGARRWTLVAFAILFIGIYLQQYNPTVSGVVKILAILVGIKAYRRYGSNSRYKVNLEIKDRQVTLSFKSKSIIDAEVSTLKIIHLESVEYFVKKKHIVFWGTTYLNNGMILDAIFVEDIFKDDVIAYLKQNGITVKYNYKQKYSDIVASKF